MPHATRFCHGVKTHLSPGVKLWKTGSAMTEAVCPPCSMASPLMKLKPLFFLLPLGLFIISMTACGKKADAANDKTADQREADQKAVFVRAAADKKTADQNEAELLKAAALKETAAAPAKTDPVPVK